MSLPEKVTDKRRDLGIDAARAISSLAIVWLHTVSVIHVGSLSNLGRFAVPFFSISSLFLLTRSKQTASFLKDCKHRGSRLMIPFAIWSLAYIGFRAIGANISGSVQPNYGISILWTGPTHHLWFCPYLTVMSIAAYSIKYSNLKKVFQTPGISIAVLASTFILCDFSQRNFPSTGDYTLRLAIDTLPAAMTGIAIGLSSDKKQAYLFSIPWAYLAVVIAIQFAYLITIGRSLTVENLLGVSIFALSVNHSVNIRFIDSFRPLAFVGSISFGIYLIHILYIEGFQDVFEIMHLSKGLNLDLTVFVISSIFSILSIWLCSQILPRKLSEWLGII